MAPNREKPPSPTHPRPAGGQVSAAEEERASQRPAWLGCSRFPRRDRGRGLEKGDPEAEPAGTEPAGGGRPRAPAPKLPREGPRASRPRTLGASGSPSREDALAVALGGSARWPGCCVLCASRRAPTPPRSTSCGPRRTTTAAQAQRRMAPSRGGSARRVSAPGRSHGDGRRSEPPRGGEAQGRARPPPLHVCADLPGTAARRRSGPPGVPLQPPLPAPVLSGLLTPPPSKSSPRLLLPRPRGLQGGGSHSDDQPATRAPRRPGTETGRRPPLTPAAASCLPSPDPTLPPLLPQRSISFWELCRQQPTSSPSLPAELNLAPLTAASAASHRRAATSQPKPQPLPTTSSPRPPRVPRPDSRPRPRVLEVLAGLAGAPLGGKVRPDHGDRPLGLSGWRKGVARWGWKTLQPLVLAEANSGPRSTCRP